MYKKIISAILIITLMNLLGCYYQEQMVPSDVKFKDKKDIQVTTKDTTYNLTGNDYYFENDTVFASVSKKLDKHRTLKFNIEIPVKEIDSVMVKRTDPLATTLTVLGVTIGALGILIVIAGASGGGNSGCQPKGKGSIGSI
ncbi:MAG: hypothetical protein P8X73_18480 [Ignavibacteriaceae bacterium]